MNDSRAIRQVVRTTAFDEALAAQLSLNPTDLRCLELVIETPNLTAGRLAELAGLTTGAVTGVLDRLERAGYVARRPDPADRRSVTVRPLPGEADRVAAALGPLDAAIEAALAERPGTERAAIAEFLARAGRIVDEETARLTAGTRGGFVGNTFSAPLAGATRGRLQVSSGAPRLALNLAPLGPRARARMVMETSASRIIFAGAAPEGELIRATFDGPAPDVRAAQGSVAIRYRRRASEAFTTRTARLALSAGIPWTIDLAGGLTDVGGALDGVPLERIEIQGGANHIKLDLPDPSGTVVVRLTGGASSVTFRRPAGFPVAVIVSGGVSHLRLDGARSGAAGGRQRIVSRGYDERPDRYEIEITGGVSDLRIDRR
jgi:DNA-binding MarR family transcriptional regulator